MTDIMKLAAQWGDARIMATRDRATNDEVLQARDAVQSAIEALQAESTSLKQIAELNAQIAIDLKAERDQLQAQLDAMGKGEPVSYGDAARRRAKQVGALWQFDDLGLSMFVGEIIGQCYAAPKALAPSREVIGRYMADKGFYLSKEALDGLMLKLEGIGGTP